ncbi:MAG: type I-C CRISPR-associated protein Cas8c/Csd1 [Armatimonadota bacterium]
MILQQLVKDAPHISETTPRLYGPQAVKWIIDIDEEGAWIQTICTSSGEKKNRGMTINAPILAAKRTCGLVPQLLCDKAVYALGLPNPKKGEVLAEKHIETANKCLGLFTAQLKDCYEQTQNPAVSAVLKFLNHLLQTPENKLQYIPEITPDDIVTWRCDGTMVIDFQDVRNYWATVNSEDDEGKKGTCQLCRSLTEIPERLPVALKNVPGGQSAGVPLVGINANAFESYGLKNACNASICSNCAEAYGQALNHMIITDKMHLRIGPVITVFWSSQGHCDEVFSLLDEPDPSAVEALLTAYRTGRKEAVEVNTANLYVVTLSGNAGRVAIRDWMDITINQAKTNLARWFDLIDTVDNYGQQGKPIKLVSLACCPYLKGKEFDQMTPQMPRTLVNSALKGYPLPLWLLSITMNRCRAEQNVSHVRAALMKAVLNSQPHMEKIMPQLNENDNRPSYVCGRLLSVIEQIQKSASPGINATLVDRYFGAASTAPATVFGNLLSDAQAHLGKLRKTNGGAYESCQRRLEEVLGLIEHDFPKTLTLHEQALFSLGYYHQRATSRAEIEERRRLKNAASQEESNE